MFVDDNGYTPLPPHLIFLKLTNGDLSDCHSHMRPLGMEPSQYENFLDSLKQALRRDSIVACDVRLKGSSANFYSGHHKLMPKDRITLGVLLGDALGRSPTDHELNTVENRLKSVWPDGTLGPYRRPFDSMHRIGIDLFRSDYDIQISSDEILEYAWRYAQSHGIQAADFTSQKYDFIRKDIVGTVCPKLTDWAAIQSFQLGRGVTVGVFSGGGPPNKEPSIGKLSSHFRDTDWILIPQKDSVSK